MKTTRLALCATTAWLVLAASGYVQAQIPEYADEVISTGDANPTRTATLTGAPDNDGYTFNGVLGGDREVVVKFNDPPDAGQALSLIVYMGGADVETGDVYVSADGATWTSIGAIPAPYPLGPTDETCDGNEYDFAYQVPWRCIFYGIQFDVSALGFQINYAKVVDTSPGGDGLELDAFAIEGAVNVAIDIKPGSDPNCFNINGHGVVPVAILGSETFDVSQVDITTLSFGGLEVRIRGNKGPLCSLEDVSGNGYLDLVCQFEDNSEYWSPGEEDNATLTGTLLDGQEIYGSDSICVVP